LVNIDQVSTYLLKYLGTYVGIYNSSPCTYIMVSQINRQRINVHQLILYHLHASLSHLLNTYLCLDYYIQPLISHVEINLLEQLYKILLDTCYTALHSSQIHKVQNMGKVLLSIFCKSITNITSTCYMISNVTRSPKNVSTKYLLWKAYFCSSGHAIMNVKYSRCLLFKM